MQHDIVLNMLKKKYVLVIIQYFWPYTTDNLNFQVVGRPTFMFIMKSQKVFVWSAQATYALK